MGGIISANQFNLVPDPVGSASRGLNLGEQFRQQQIKLKQDQFLQGVGGEGASGQNALQDSAKLGLDFQQKFAKGLGIIDERTGQIDQKKLVEVADFSFKVQNLPIEQQNIAINKRIEEIEGRGGDATQTRELLSTPFEQRKNALQIAQLAALPNDVRLKFMSGEFDRSRIKSFAPQANADGGLSIPQVMPDGSVKFVPVPGSVAETSIEKGARGVEEKIEIEEAKTTEAVKREINKLTTKRKQGFVDTGVEAADSLANIKRSMDLLDEVETGGIDAALLRGKQVFGIESANEAELSAGLGKAILSQLRPIFGAAFTEAEGARLERIEAGFGKSTAGNKRLLEQLLKIVDRSVKRGLAAAEDLGDEFTADQIREASSLDISPAGDGELTPEEEAELAALKAELGEG